MPELVLKLVMLNSLFAIRREKYVWWNDSIANTDTDGELVAKTLCRAESVIQAGYVRENLSCDAL